MNAALVVPCSREFIPGLMVMDSSIRLHNPDLDEIPRILFSDDIKSFPGWEVRRVNHSRYAHIPNHGRHVKAWYRLESLTLAEFETVVVMGADFLCMGDIGELFQPTGYDMRAALDLGIQRFGVEHKNGSYRINSDLIVFGKRMLSPLHLNAILEYGETCRDDQVAINEYVMVHQGIIMEYLDPKFNLLKRTPIHRPRLWATTKDDIRLLHFVGHKPWDFMPRRGDDAGDRYTEIERLWWDEWMRAGHSL